MLEIKTCTLWDYYGRRRRNQSYCDYGTSVEHSDIDCRSRPYGVGKSGMYAVLDSTNGTLILEPDEETVAQIKSAGTEQIEVTEEARDYAQVYTQDGIPVHLSANIVLTEESEMSAVQNTAGIGLFRSEFLF